MRLKNETITTDAEGNQHTSSKTYSIKVSQESFYYSFIENMSGIFKITAILDIKVLACFCGLAEYNTGRVLVTRSIREDIMNKLSTNDQNMSNSIKRLKGLDLLSGDKGTYQVNPKVFWKGSLDKRREVILQFTTQD